MEPSNQTPEPVQQVPVDLGQAPKTKKNRLWILIALVLCFVLLGASGYMFLQSQKSPEPVLETNSAMEDLAKNTVPNPPEPSISEKKRNEVPTPNHLYLGTYQNDDAMFVTNNKMSVYYKGGEPQTDPLIGDMININGGGNSPFHYNDLLDAQDIGAVTLSAADEFMGIGSFKLNEDKSMAYVIIDVIPEGKEYPHVRQELYQVDLKTSSHKKLWDNVIASETYPKAGAASVDRVVEDKFLTLVFGVCYACEGFDPHGSLVLNIETGKETYLGEVDDFEFDLEENTVSHKKLMPFEEPCDPGMGCNDGKRTVYKPTGETSTTELP